MPNQLSTQAPLECGLKAEGGELRNPWLSESGERRWNKNIGEAEEVEKETIPEDITEDDGQDQVTDQMRARREGEQAL